MGEDRRRHQDRNHQAAADCRSRTIDTDQSKIAPVTFKPLGVCVCARYNVWMNFDVLVPFVLCSQGRRQKASPKPSAVAPREPPGCSRVTGLPTK